METVADDASSRGIWWRLLADTLVIGWVVLWIVIGVAVDRQVRSLTSVSDSISAAATTVDQTADALAPLERLPLVGDSVRLAVQRIRMGAADASADAASTRNGIDHLAGLLGWSVAIAPAVPIAVGYAAYRVTEARRRRFRRRTHGPPAVALPRSAAVAW
jgi:hypothetical protein